MYLGLKSNHHFLDNFGLFEVTAAILINVKGPAITDRAFNLNAIIFT